MSGSDNINDSRFIDELRKGFDRLSNDIKSTMSSVSSGINRLSSDVGQQAQMTESASRRFTNTTGSKMMSFMGETFSREFNKPALWSRDLVYMAGRDPRDMTKRQARYYAEEHWKQRGAQFKDSILRDAVPPLLYLGLGPLGLPIGMAYEGIVGQYVPNQKRLHEWTEYLDKSSQNYVLAGKSQNDITGMGWSASQRKELGLFHLRQEKENKYFKPEEQLGMAGMASDMGYFDKTSTIDQYKVKYRALLDGTKEAMKTLHMSMEEAIQTMATIGQMQITDTVGFTKRVGLAAAISGLSTEQVLQYSKSMGTAYNNSGVGIATAQKIAVENINSGVPQLTGQAVNKMINDPKIIAGFMGENGQIDQAKVTKLLSGQWSAVDIMKSASSYLNSLSGTAEIINFTNTAADILTRDISPEKMPRVAANVEWQWITARYPNATAEEKEIYARKYYKDRNYTPEQINKAIAYATNPFYDTNEGDFVSDQEDYNATRWTPEYKIGKFFSNAWRKTWGTLAETIESDINNYGVGPFSRGALERYQPRIGEPDPHGIREARVLAGNNMTVKLANELGTPITEWWDLTYMDFLEHNLVFEGDARKLKSEYRAMGIPLTRGESQAMVVMNQYKKYLDIKTAMTNPNTISGAPAELVGKGTSMYGYVTKTMGNADIGDDRDHSWIPRLIKMYDEVDGDKSIVLANIKSWMVDEGWEMPEIAVNVSGLSPQDEHFYRTAESEMYRKMSTNTRMSKKGIEQLFEGSSEVQEFFNPEGKYKDMSLSAIEEDFLKSRYFSKKVKNTNQREELIGEFLDRSTTPLEGGVLSIREYRTRPGKKMGEGSTMEEISNNVSKSFTGNITYQQMQDITTTIWLLMSSVKAVNEKVLEIKK